MPRRSQHCIDNHGAATERTSQGGCRLCRYERTRDKQRQKRAAVAAYKTERGCGRCGFNAHPDALHLHHRDPSTKEMNVGALTASGWGRIWAEVEKCDVICANCHAVLHAEERISAQGLE